MYIIQYQKVSGPLKDIHTSEWRKKVDRRKNIEISCGVPIRSTGIKMDISRFEW